MQLHAAVVELSTARGAEIKYSTVQNWFAGDANGVGGIYNFVTKRGLCHGANSKISWTQVRKPTRQSWMISATPHLLSDTFKHLEAHSVTLTCQSYWAMQISTSMTPFSGSCWAVLG